MGNSREELNNFVGVTLLTLGVFTTKDCGRCKLDDGRGGGGVHSEVRDDLSRISSTALSRIGLCVHEEVLALVSSAVSMVLLTLVVL